jgi:hypothetical protein
MRLREGFTRQAWLRQALAKSLRLTVVVNSLCAQPHSADPSPRPTPGTAGFAAPDEPSSLADVAARITCTARITCAAAVRLTQPVITQRRQEGYRLT